MASAAARIPQFSPSTMFVWRMVAVLVLLAVSGSASHNSTPGVVAKLAHKAEAQLSTDSTAVLDAMALRDAELIVRAATAEAGRIVASASRVAQVRCARGGHWWWNPCHVTRGFGCIAGRDDLRMSARPRPPAWDGRAVPAPMQRSRRVRQGVPV